MTAAVLLLAAVAAEPVPMERVAVAAEGQPGGPKPGRSEKDASEQ